MSHVFGANIVLETRRSSASIEPLNDLLACLEPELWPNKLIVPQNQKHAEKACLQLAACADSEDSPGEHDRELIESSIDL